MLRRHAGIHDDLPHVIVEALRAHAVKFLSVNGQFSTVHQPNSRATATAVSLWSPVIITVRIPARRQSSMDFFASGRGGVRHRDKPGEGQVVFRGLLQRGVPAQLPPGERQDP